MFRSYTGLYIKALLLGTLIACHSDPLTVSTDAGLVSGTTDAAGDVRMFKGIPFAAPPVGPLRWREPQPVTSWTGARRCVAFGPNPIQENWGECNEDCLYLNVWTTKGNSWAKKPVIVWIYGGGFTGGSGAGSWCDGEPMARKGVVFVTFNYRVGVLGFLAHPALSSESPNHVSGNYGILDQIAALQCRPPQKLHPFIPTRSSLRPLLERLHRITLFAGPLIRTPQRRIHLRCRCQRNRLHTSIDILLRHNPTRVHRAPPPPRIRIVRIKPHHATHYWKRIPPPPRLVQQDARHRLPHHHRRMHRNRIHLRPSRSRYQPAHKQHRQAQHSNSQNPQNLPHHRSTPDQGCVRPSIRARFQHNLTFASTKRAIYVPTILARSWPKSAGKSCAASPSHL